MLVALQVPGANEPLLRRMLALLCDINEAHYRSRPNLERIDALGEHTFRPDTASDSIVLVSAASMGRTVSCGTASAAYVGWYRARGVDAHVSLRLVNVGEGATWHACAIVPGNVPALWDPAVELPR